MSELLGRTQKLKAEQERLERLIQEDTMDANVGKLLQGQSFANGVLMHMATTNEALRRIDESMADVKRDVNDMKVNGLKVCEGRRVEIEHLKESDKEQWTAINRANRSPRQRATALGFGSAGVGGVVVFVLNWLWNKLNMG